MTPEKTFISNLNAVKVESVKQKVRDLSAKLGSSSVFKVIGIAGLLIYLFYIFLASNHFSPSPQYISSVILLLQPLTLVTLCLGFGIAAVLKHGEIKNPTPIHGGIPTKPVVLHGWIKHQTSALGLPILLSSECLKTLRNFKNTMSMECNLQSGWRKWS